MNRPLGGPGREISDKPHWQIAFHDIESMI